MREVLLLLRLRFRALAASMFARGKNKITGVGALILLGVLFGIVFLSFASIFFSLFIVMRDAAAHAGTDPSLYLAFAAALALGLCLFGSTFTAQSELYQPKDNEFLLSMPLRPSAIFVSRLLLLVTLNLLYGSVVALPAFVVYCLYDFTVWGALLFLFFFLLIFFVALAISCLLGWLIALVSSRIKRKNIVSLVFSLIFLVVYFFAISSMELLIEEMDANILGFTAAASPYLTVFFPIAAGILGTDLLSPILFTLISLGAIAAVATVLIRSYTAILTANRGGVQYVYREKKAKEGSPFLALIRKELSRFTSSPAYMLNAGLGLVIAPGIAIFLLTARADLAAFAADPELSFVLPLLPTLIAAASVFLSSTVIISAPSISLEAKTVWLLQSMPLPARTVLLAKTCTHILVSAPFLLLFSILSGIALSASPMDFVGLLLLPQAASVFCAFFGTVIGFLLPKFDWTTEAAAVKSGAAIAIVMFGMMAISLVIDVIAVVPFFFGLPAWFGALIATLLLGGTSVGFYGYLSSRAAERRFARLQN